MMDVMWVDVMVASMVVNSVVKTASLTAAQLAAHSADCLAAWMDASLATTNWKRKI